MPIFKATIDVFMEVDGDGEACDCLAETMREHLRRYAPESSVIDWRYHERHPHPVELDELPADLEPA